MSALFNTTVPVLVGSVVPDVKLTVDCVHRIPAGTTVIYLSSDNFEQLSSSRSGVCFEFSNTTFHCSCSPGWQGRHCETKISYCTANTCLNGGICRTVLLNYTCECLSLSYSGRHCEMTATGTKVRQIVARSFAYVAIIAMSIAAFLVGMLDFLKYFFNIDSVDKPIRPKKPPKRKKPHYAIHFTYVHTSTPEVAAPSNVL